MKPSTKRLLSILTATAAFALAAILMSTPALAQAPGADLYKSKCQACHGPDGSGDTVMGKKLGANDLRGPVAQKLTDAQISEVILKGKDKMKGFEGRVTADDVKALVAYVRELAKKK